MDKWLLSLVYQFNGYGILLYILLTLIFAAVLSSLIGLERQLKGEPVGIRTHALLAIGCSLLMTVSIWAIRIADGSIDLFGMDRGASTDGLNYDTSRIAAGIVTGVGFLGGGVIIKDKFTVKGLSSAATLWICAAIGMAVGAGFVLEATIATAITIVTLLLFGQILDWIDDKSPSIIVKVKGGYPVVSAMREFAEANGLPLRLIKILSVTEDFTEARVYFSHKTDKQMLAYLKGQLLRDEQYLSVDIDGKKRREKAEKTIKGL